MHPQATHILMNATAAHAAIRATYSVNVSLANRTAAQMLKCRRPVGIGLPRASQNHTRIEHSRGAWPYPVWKKRPLFRRIELPSRYPDNCRESAKKWAIQVLFL